MKGGIAGPRRKPIKKRARDIEDLHLAEMAG
jgi:hypothetical protein